MLRPFLTALALLGLLSGCATSSSRDPASESDLAAATDPYRLPGVSETVLVADGSGKASLVSLGDPTTVAPVGVTAGSGIVAGRSHEGRFWVITEAGDLLVIDPHGGAPSRRALGISGPADLEIDGADRAWVSAGRSLVHVDTSTGATLATIDLGVHALDGGEVRAGGIKRVGDRLFVQLSRHKGAEQRGAIVVVDPGTASVDRVLELEAPKPGGGTEIGYDPGGAMVVDAVHQKLLVTARGFRPSNTGMVLRIDLAERKVDPWFFRSGSGFQGGLAPGATPDALFIGYHTSTPVASTHLFHFEIKGNGELVESEAGALLDAFEVVDDYPSNATSTLFALPVTCPAGFCLGGRGVSFIDAKTGKPHPRLSEAAIGMSPTFVLFL